jgi:hypothetical protein
MSPLAYLKIAPQADFAGGRLASVSAETILEGVSA